MKNIDKLVVGDTYSYRQLCELFEERQEAGNSRNAQFKRWKQYFRWTKPTTQQYRIEEIYLVPKPVDDKRKHNGGNHTGKFAELDCIIMETFNGTEEIKTTIARLAEEIGLLSEQYSQHRYDYTEFCKNNDLSIEFVSEYFYNIRSCVHRAIERSIERLQNEGFIHTENYYVLVLENNTKKTLSVDEIRYFETEIENITGINRCLIKNAQQYRDFTKKVNSLIEQLLGVSLKYYYKEYRLTKTSKNYVSKTDGDKCRLTRKFVFTIAYNMIKYIYRLANQEYIDNPVDGTTQLISEEYDSDETSKMIHDVFELSNCFFVYMNQNSWKAYIEEDELGDSDKELLLFSIVCFGLFGAEIKNKKKPPSFREEAVNELGIGYVNEIEKVLPDIDWDRVCIDEEYTERYAEAMGKYYDQIDLFCYSNEKYKEEYSIYVARLYAHGKECEQMHLFDFAHMLDENDRRFECLI